MICFAEQSGKPYDQLDLPIYDSWDEKEFWDFLKWMTIPLIVKVVVSKSCFFWLHVSPGLADATLR